MCYESLSDCSAVFNLYMQKPKKPKYQLVSMNHSKDVWSLGAVCVYL